MECLLSLDAEYFVFQFASKNINTKIQNSNVTGHFCMGLRRILGPNRVVEKTTY
jgi:hypothetical protein